MSPGNFITDISRHIWETKYRYHDGNTFIDQSIEDTWQRIAAGLAEAEPVDNELWQKRFYSILENFRFLPAGRIHAGINTGRRVTLFNCFVMGQIEDSMDGIFDSLKEGALTMQQGGGVGYDFSTLRPAGTMARMSGSYASGPVSFMNIWDTMCGTLLSTGVRRGAMMATLRCDHPDIETFITAKQDKTKLRHFNLSVQVTDEFMHAVDNDTDWPLIFPETGLAEDSDAPVIERRWTGNQQPARCRILKHVRARDLWDKIMHATYDYAEPGVLFVDRINEMNNLYYREQISATNPCGEIPLPPYGACDLGSINLTAFINEPFSKEACLDFDALKETAAIAVRMLDNVIDVSQFPLDKQQEQAQGSRRIGLGISGLADTLIMLGHDYGSQEAVQLASEIMEVICHSAYRTSIDLAREKGAFPFFDKDKYLHGKFIQSLPEGIQTLIAKHGIRNSHLLAIAPTGTISLLANNISSGLEPVFNNQYTRKMLEADGSFTSYQLTDFAVMKWQELKGSQTPLPDIFSRQTCLTPEMHLNMQAALQSYVDNAISKTINVPDNFSFNAFKDVYKMAHAKGLKGCTTFRSNPITGSVLAAGDEFEQGHQCCGIDREID
ncbi:MAG: adenosylcobalamin-dependent ribonucleoside-diphosphate reductase [Gammaproteobacteria bacterium]|nr:adenosylcobalamin-dependent ribonucleoside-diphosphate reductase [Gammaproteobacteria bacterium]MDH5613494.1 adenosylcobalamin-dependent ribonucleoside-diphosphate reductase [Gammaproteobacteria bacterium]